MSLSRLRERNKARTRDDIIEAALGLFESRGYDATTCEEIAAAAEVSTRTFFRYFDTKLEVVMAAKGDEHREQNFFTMLAARPADEGPVDALRNAVREPMAELQAGGTIAARQYCLMMLTPSLRALALEHFHEHEGELARAFALRLGRPDDDPGARVLAAAAVAALRTAMDQWVAAGAQPDGLSPRIDEALDLLEHGLGGLSQPTSRRAASAPVRRKR